MLTYTLPSVVVCAATAAAPSAAIVAIRPIAMVVVRCAHINRRAAGGVARGTIWVAVHVRWGRRGRRKWAGWRAGAVCIQPPILVSFTASPPPGSGAACASPAPDGAGARAPELRGSGGRTARGRRRRIPAAADGRVKQQTRTHAPVHVPPRAFGFSPHAVAAQVSALRHARTHGPLGPVEPTPGVGRLRGVLSILALLRGRAHVHRHIPCVRRRELLDLRGRADRGGTAREGHAAAVESQPARCRALGLTRGLPLATRLGVVARGVLFE